MKTLYKNIILIILAMTITVSCIKTKKRDRSGLTALVISNSAKGTATDKFTNGSLVILSRADLSNLSFTGQCFDTFTVKGAPVSPSNYYNTLAGGAGGALNTDLKKHALSTSNCSSLSFTGTTNTNLGSSTQRPDPNDGFTFRMYTCDPNNNPCAKTAITASGF